jgi:predicted dienelactone hydrolase
MKVHQPLTFTLFALVAWLHVTTVIADDAAAPDLFKVGMVTRHYVDEHRKSWSGTTSRPLRTAIWYPAAVGAMETEAVGAPMFDGGNVAPAADLSTRAGTYPLILLSHGTGGSAIQLMWLGRYLAARGYIVAAVNHHGNTGVEKYQAQGFMLFWERPKDLSVALDLLLADPLIGSHIDQDRIGAAGFSLGGYTVITIAGGQFDLERYDHFCASPEHDFTCGPQAEFPDARRQFEALRSTDPVVQESLARASDSYRDTRIRAVFAIAPVLGGGFAKRDLKAIKIPVEIVVGDADSVATPPTNAQYFAANIKGSRLTVLPGGVGHYTFLADCTGEGRGGLPICRDAKGLDRAAIHRQVGEMAYGFFERALKVVRPAT